MHLFWSKNAILPPFSLIRDFGKQNIRGNVSKISVSLTCYRQIGSTSTNHSPLAWRKDGQKVTLVAVIGGFWSDLSITRKIDGNFGNVSAGVFQSRVSMKTVVSLWHTFPWTFPSFFPFFKYGAFFQYAAIFHISPTFVYVPHFLSMPHFSKWAALCKVCRTFPSVPHFSKCGALFHVSRTFPRVAHFSMCGALFQVPFFFF